MKKPCCHTFPVLFRLLAAALLITGCASSDSGGAPDVGLRWTWTAGSDTPNQPGVYGTLGEGTSYTLPGGRIAGAAWMGTAGKIWIAGGYGIDRLGIEGFLTDLWKRRGGAWTWAKGFADRDHSPVAGTQGIPNPANVPGGRYSAASWMDSAGRGWIYGGQGISISGNNGQLCDLWTLDTVSENWTWMGGEDSQSSVFGTMGIPNPANWPAARRAPAYWGDPDAGEYWVFGGENGNGILGDLWRYAGGAWTWMGGADAPDQYGVYGTVQVPNPLNRPGTRHGSVAWRDESGKAWLFGGTGLGEEGGAGYLTDMWRFDLATGQWAWMQGAKTIGARGVYGTSGVAGPLNHPGGRKYASAWADSSGRLWLYGGKGYADTTTSEGYLDDVWMFDTVSLRWTWMGGSKTLNAAPEFVTMGVAGGGPGGRTKTSIVLDAQGTPYFLGGEQNSGYYSDIWTLGP